MMDRGLKPQIWLVIWNCLTHMENASLFNAQPKGRRAGRPSLAMSVSVNQMTITLLIRLSDLN